VELQLCDLVVGSQIVTEGDLPQKKRWVLTWNSPLDMGFI
jgi:hypothetical protein